MSLNFVALWLPCLSGLGLGCSLSGTWRWSLGSADVLSSMPFCHMESVKGGVSFCVKSF